MLRALAVLALVLLAGCGSGAKAKPAGTPAPHESAGDAVKRQLTEVAAGQFGREWDELHPAQQTTVTRGAYQACAAKTGLPQLEQITVKETYADPLDLTSVPEKTSSAVTVSYVEDLGSRKVPQTETFHEVNVAGVWRWVMEDSAVAAYAAGKCP